MPTWFVPPVMIPLLCGITHRYRRPPPARLTGCLSPATLWVFLCEEHCIIRVLEDAPPGSVQFRISSQYASVAECDYLLYE